MISSIAVTKQTLCFPGLNKGFRRAIVESILIMIYVMQL